MKKSELKQLIKEEIESIIKEETQTGIMLGYLILWNGIPSHINYANFYESEIEWGGKNPDDFDFVITYKEKMVKGDMIWFLYKSENEAQKLVNDINNSRVLSKDWRWRDYKKFEVEENVNSNQFQVVPVSISW